MNQLELSAAWEAVLGAMERQIGSQDVEIWLRESRLLEVTPETATVQVGNRYYYEWIRDNYSSMLEGEVRSRFGSSVRLAFTISEGAEPPDPVGTPELEETSGDPPPLSVGVNTGQTFANFVVGECNKFAHAAARAVADHPATNYNPLFMYGATGLGKTHLMHSVGNEILAKDPTARIMYVTAEDFMNEMIFCLRYKRMEDFRDKYRRRADLLLVDDIQFLSGKERTQEEFFHTFNALQSSGRQIVLTSDVVPRDIDKLEPRLRTRFEGGLLADLQAPDKETLLAILWQKADNHGLHLPRDLCNVIADTVAGNIRELEGLLNRLAALHNFYDEPITLDFARQRLPAFFTPKTTVVTVSRIIEVVASFHNLRSADITGSKRTRTLTEPRHLAMFLARKHTSLSFPELGREFGGRDHSTIQHGFKKVQSQMKRDHDLAHKVKLLEQTLSVGSSV